MSEVEKPKKNRKKRNNILIFLALFFIVSGGSYGLYYYMYGQFYQTTDNAYVGQNIIYVTPQVSGTVDEVFVSEMQYVKAGDTLGHLDTRNAKLAFNEAKTDLAQTVRKIKQIQIQKEEAQNAISLAQVDADKAKDDLQRNEFLAKKHAISDEKYKNIKYAYEASYQNLEIMRKKLLSLNAIVNDTNISKNPEVENAILQVKRSYLDLKRCDIIAPASGVIAKKNFTIGENVGVQSTLMAIVPTQGFWVDANFKETQLQHMGVDQDVILTSDLYGSDVVYHGKIEGIAPGTGAVFSLLPAQNASGNWIKIVQRIPVRIKLNQAELEKHPLQVGSSMSATVDIHNQKGIVLKHIKIAEKNDPSFKLYQNAMKESEAIVKDIVEQNL